MSGNVECFKHCKQLYKLHISYPELTEHFFTNIQSFIPKLQILKILSPEKFSNTFSDLFNSMKSIQRVELYDYSPNNYPYKTWYFGKCLTEVMLSSKGKEVIRVNERSQRKLRSN